MDLPYFKLVGREIVRCGPEEWARFFETGDRIVGKTDIGPYWVSTVFLGIDHNNWGHGPPILFETMIFEAETTKREIFGRAREYHEEVGGWQTRCATYDEAEAMHRSACEAVHRWIDAAADSLPPEFAGFKPAST